MFTMKEQHLEQKLRISERFFVFPGPPGPASVCILLAPALSLYLPSHGLYEKRKQ